jgi:hypothetical protein
MCKRDEAIRKLEQELEQSRQREADLFKTIAEGNNFQSQVIWRPWQVAMIPIVISLVALIVAIAK